MDPQSEIYILFSRWLTKTEAILRHELRKRKIGVTDDLFKELTTDIQVRGQAVLEGNLTMLTRGRFIDMGVGRGHSLGGSRGSFDLDSGRTRKGRKPKKWYSRPWHGRLHSLYGAIGYSLVEQSIASIKDPIVEK